MEILTRRANHEPARSHDCIMAKHGKTIVKMTYQAYNAVEAFSVEIFDGHALHPILSLRDLGYSPESSAYNIWSPEMRKARATTLIEETNTMLNYILK